MISRFPREDHNCALPDHYAEICGNFLPTFWDDLSVPFSGFKNYHYSLRNNPEERSSQLS
jgi:hypothetical protein